MNTIKSDSTAKIKGRPIDNQSEEIQLPKPEAESPNPSVSSGSVKFGEICFTNNVGGINSASELNRNASSNSDNFGEQPRITLSFN